MVTYAVFKNDDEFEVVNLTDTVEQVMEQNPDYDYITAVIDVASMIEATHIVSDKTHERIALMFPNAKIVDYKGGDIN